MASAPIDTPALEYLEILTGKGGEETDKQLYRFQDHGGRWVGLRFDLTVPLARFAAQHIGELGTPFKRYHIATVWRGENTQRGRYREFAPQFNWARNTALIAQIQRRVDLHGIVHVEVRPILTNGLHQRQSRVSPHRQVFVQRLDQFTGILFIVNHRIRTPSSAIGA